MTVPELIDRVLEKIRREFYHALDESTFYTDRIRNFKRDERALTRAIATYGHECHQRGWAFEADFIYRELMELLLKIRTAEAEIKYLPVYLEGAIRRHVGQRAEELSARARTLAPKVTTILNKLKPVEAIREPSAVEIFSQVYQGLRKIQRNKKLTRRRSGEQLRKWHSGQATFLELNPS